MQEGVEIASRNRGRVKSSLWFPVGQRNTANSKRNTTNSKKNTAYLKKWILLTRKRNTANWNPLSHRMTQRQEMRHKASYCCREQESITSTKQIIIILITNLIKIIAISVLHMYLVWYGGSLEVVARDVVGWQPNKPPQLLHCIGRCNSYMNSWFLRCRGGTSHY